LQWKNGTWSNLSSRASVCTCRYHSTSAPYTFNE